MPNSTTAMVIDVKRLREAKGLTRRRLAELCGVTERTVQNWEDGSLPENFLRMLSTLGALNPDALRQPPAHEPHAVADVRESLTALNNQRSQLSTLMSSVERRDDIVARALSIIERHEGGCPPSTVIPPSPCNPPKVKP